MQKVAGARLSSREVFTHDKVRSGAINKAVAAFGHSRTEASNQDLFLIPENSSESKQAVVVTPEDLIGITNANAVFSVDYINEAEQILGAILYIRTEGEVYEHTKPICDRLNGGVLADIRHVYVQGKPFILSRIDQPDGQIDYTISFVAYEDNNGYTIDNRWRNDSYYPEAQAKVLNFQVWSVSPNHTMVLVERLLKAMEQQEQVAFNNQYPPAIPAVYVKSGYYDRGQLHLTLQNNAHAQQGEIWGTLAATEDGQREPFLTSIPLDGGEYKMSIPVSKIFDAGFTLANNAAGGLDALYLADGPWGVDYERGGATISDFKTEVDTTQASEHAYVIERSAHIEGKVLTYASMFRSLTPGILPQDLQQYAQLSFQASGSGSYEVILTKKSVTKTAEQFRYTFILDQETRNITVPFSQLANRNGEQRGGFTAEDITAVVFNALGDGMSNQPFRLRVEDVHFDKAGTSNLADNIDSPSSLSQVLVYPNPARDVATIRVNQLSPGEKVVVSLLTISGKFLQTLNEEVIDHEGNWYYESPVSLPSGLYLLKVTSSHEQKIYKFIKQ